MPDAMSAAPDGNAWFCCCASRTSFVSPLYFIATMARAAG